MARGLRPELEGRRLRALKVLDPFLLEACTVPQIEAAARRAVVEAIERRGKWISFVFEGRKGIIVIQPRMSGGFRVDPAPPPSHARLSFHLEGSKRIVWYCDTRRLGRVAWHPDRDAAESAFARSQGPDALEIALDQFAEKLSKTSRGVKPALLDQKIVAGIGNIYADEILFHARLHPETTASALSADETARLHQSIKPVLLAAIEAEGSSFDAHYRTVLGREGGYLKRSAVHFRKGLPCRVCRSPIVKTRIAGLIGRPTYYCPTCQSSKRASGPSGRNRGDRLS